MPEPSKPDPAKPDLSYTCPHCGQPAVVGNHFCSATKAPPTAPAKKTKKLPVSVWTLAIFGLSIIALWRVLGPASLLVAAFGAVLWLLWPRKPR